MLSGSQAVPEGSWDAALWGKLADPNVPGKQADPTVPDAIPEGTPEVTATKV